MRYRKIPLVLGVGAALVATAAYALTQMAIETPIALSVADEESGALGFGASKSKLFRHRDGTLVAVYGDYVDEEKLVYDLKGQRERPARDNFVRTCKEGEERDDQTAKTCMIESDWTAPVNISQSAAQSSIQANWRGDGLEDYWGDAEKPNGFINPNGVTVVSWVSHYCPGGVQRARLYIERDSRTIPFTCTWVAYSTDYGQTWEDPVQLSSGERAAKQDVNRGTTAFWAVTWQEDPTGLELGQAEGPGDGASGANISGGTDVWYAWAAVSGGPGTTTLGEWNAAVRLTDNFEGKTGTSGSQAIVFDGNGIAVPDDQIEKGRAGAARPNTGSVGNTVIVAWEEKKGSEGLDEGKFIRYLSFTFNSPPQGSTIEGVTVGVAGCIISNPERNARRVRFVTQSPTDAGANGIQIGIFWKEGVVSQGGPSDIVFRAGIGGVTASHLKPAVDPGCATSVYEETQALQHEPAQNVSSRTKEVAATGIDNLGDDTQEQFTENALAHRGILRGRDMWLGYSYTENLALLTYLNADNYNFWIRKFNVDAFNTDPNSAWARPKQVSNITDTTINLREPRLVGTQPSGPACDAINDPTGPDCRNTEVFFVAWGAQTNVSPWAPEDAEDLGLWITRTTDAGQTYEPVVQLSVAQGVFGGSLVDDEEGENAFESQLQARPDGNKIYAVWNQRVSETDSLTKFAVGEPEVIPVTPVSRGKSGSSSGCSVGNGPSPFDPLLPGLALMALGYLALRRRMLLGK